MMQVLGFGEDVVFRVQVLGSIERLKVLERSYITFLAFLLGFELKSSL